MTCITLYQPHAQLVADGRKWIETRSWQPPIDLLNERIGIHAATRWTREERAQALAFGYADPYDPDKPRDLPRGVILATARLAGWFLVREHEVWQAPYSDRGERIVRPVALCEQAGEAVSRVRTPDIDNDQCRYGDLSTGRWGWILRDIEPLQEPIPARGRQCFWTYESPTVPIVQGELDIQS